MKHAAGVPLGLELEEGRMLVESRAADATGAALVAVALVLASRRARG